MPTKIWRVIQSGIVCAHVGSHRAKHGVKRHRAGDGREGYQERFSAESGVYIEISSMQKNYPHWGEDVEGRYKKEECPRERHSLQTPELERAAQDDWNSEFKGSQKERWIQEVSRRQIVRSHIIPLWDLHFTLKASRNNRRIWAGGQLREEN